MQIVSTADNLRQISDPVYLGKNMKNISKCCLLKILPRVLSVNAHKVVHIVYMNRVTRISIRPAKSDHGIHSLQVYSKVFNERNVIDSLIRLHRYAG